MNSKSSPRIYRSALREEQAAATRRRVLEAAADCFSRKGYGGTSLADIGVRAGVSTETVKASGPKRDLLLRAFEQAFAGEESEEQIAESAVATTLMTIPDNDEFLTAIAGFVATANARTSVLWTELLSAANADESVARALDGLLARRRRDYAQLVGLFITRGMAPAEPEIDVEAAAATLSFLWSPESHQQLVLQNGWDMDRYRCWLADMAGRQFTH